MRTDLLSPSDKKLEEPHDTRKLIAKDLGWSTGKVAMAEMVYKKGPEELKEKLRKEQVSLFSSFFPVVISVKSCSTAPYFTSNFPKRYKHTAETKTGGK